MAVLFVAAGPVDRRHVARLLDVSIDRLVSLIAQLTLTPPPGLRVQRSGDDLQLVTAANVGPVVERYLGIPAPTRLSRAALESLAVVAYRQPVTRGEIDAVRGVNSDSSVTTLLVRGLVAEVGRRESVGRPALLATTVECLQYLGLTSLEELPPLPTEPPVGHR